MTDREAEPQRIVFDLDTWSIGDLDDFEQELGYPLSRAFAPRKVVDGDGDPILDNRGKPIRRMQMLPKELLTIVWIIKRQENPEFTMADARKVPVAALVLDEPEDGDGADPEEQDAATAD